MRLFDSILNLMGRGQNDPKFEELVLRLDESPEIMSLTEFGVTYLFPRSGLSIEFMEATNCFTAAFMSQLRRGGNLPNGSESDDLPMGVRWGSEPSEVREQLGLTPTLARKFIDKWKESFDLDENEILGIDMIFKDDGEKRHLLHARVRHKPSFAFVDKFGVGATLKR